jgi:hypothetical protein
LKISRAANKAQLIDARGRDLKAITLTWSSDAGTGFALATDIAYAVGYDETTGEIVVNSGAETRDTEQIDLTFSENVGTHVVHTWLTFMRADGTIGFAQTYGTVPLS